MSTIDALSLGRNEKRTISSREVELPNFAAQLVDLPPSRV
jgi:hypothetical protein